MTQVVDINKAKVIYFQANKYTRLSSVPEGLCEQAIVFNNDYNIDAIDVHGSTVDTILKHKENNTVEQYLDGRRNEFKREITVRIEDYIFLYVFQSAYYYDNKDKTYIRYVLEGINSYT